MQGDSAHWNETDREMGFYYQPEPQRHPQMYQHDPNAYRGSSTWTEYPQQPPSAPCYSYYNHHHHHHQQQPYTAAYPSAYPAAYDGSPPPGFGAPTPPLREDPSPPPSMMYIHPSSSDSQHLSVPSSDLVYEIRDADVLCGRGAPSHHHNGNRLFRSLVSQYQSSYLAARRINKPEIATHIVDSVRARGGRFLKRCKVEGVGPCGHFCW